MGARCPLSDDERADVWQVLRQIRQHAIRAVGLLSDSDTARAAVVAKIDVMLIELSLLRDRLRAADRADAGLRHCPGLQVPRSPATRRGQSCLLTSSLCQTSKNHQGSAPVRSDGWSS
jgi:hypothetical protein